MLLCVPSITRYRENSDYKALFGCNITRHSSIYNSSLKNPQNKLNSVWQLNPVNFSFLKTQKKLTFCRIHLLSILQRHRTATRVPFPFLVSICLFCFCFISNLCLHLSTKAKRPPKHQLLHPCPFVSSPCHLTTASSSFLILEPELLHLRPLVSTLNPNLKIEKESQSFAWSLFFIQIGGRLTCLRNFNDFSEHYE